MNRAKELAMSLIDGVRSFSEVAALIKAYHNPSYLALCVASWLTDSMELELRKALR